MATQTLISLRKLPPALSEYQWADIIELLCLVNPDGMVSNADVIDRVGEIKGIGEELQPAPELEILEPPPEGELGPLDAHLPEIGAGQEHDALAKRFQDWIRHIEYRQNVFGSAYPFEISEDRNTILLRRITSGRRIYVFFLIAANLENLTEDRVKRKFRNHFEIVSKVALEAYLPSPAMVYLFGSNPLNRGRYRGTTWSRIQKLSNDLNEILVCTEDDFPPTSTGDNGLDLVGWLPTNDNADGRAIFFGQCGTGEDWEDKQHESGYDRWRRFIQMTAPPVNFAFIPYCFRSAGGKWFNSTRIYTVLIDRVRLVRLLTENVDRAISAMPLELVERAIKEKEPLV